MKNTPSTIDEIEAMRESLKVCVGVNWEQVNRLCNLALMGLVVEADGSFRVLPEEDASAVARHAMARLRGGVAILEAFGGKI